MRRFLITLLFLPLSVLAQKHDAQANKKDAERHRAMAAAHEQAAKCLESGQSHDMCQRQLQAACKGLGIGKYCGMKHEH
jgi:hypothetical protein